MIQHLLQKPNVNAISVSVVDCYLPQAILQQWHISFAFRIPLFLTRKTVKREKKNVTKFIRKVI